MAVGFQCIYSESKQSMVYRRIEFSASDAGIERLPDAHIPLPAKYEFVQEYTYRELRELMHENMVSMIVRNAPVGSNMVLVVS